MDFIFPLIPAPKQKAVNIQIFLCTVKINSIKKLPELLSIVRIQKYSILPNIVITAVVTNAPLGQFVFSFY